MSPFQYAFRSLKKSPGFVAVALACLTLALGLITTTYAVLDSVVNPRVPFDDSWFWPWLARYRDREGRTLEEVERVRLQELQAAPQVVERSITRKEW